MRSDQDLCQAFIEAHPSEAARVLEGLAPAEVGGLCRTLTPRACALVFEHLIPTLGAQCLNSMPEAGAAAVFSELSTDVAAGLLRRMDDGPRLAVMAAMDPDIATPLRSLLSYGEGSAASLVDPRAITLTDDETAGRALSRVRRSPRHLFHYLYVIDRERRLVGVLTLQHLMLAAPREPVSAVMREPVVHLRADAERAAILAHPGWRQFHALPVIDRRSVFLGAIRYQTFRRLQEEAREGARYHYQGAVATAFALSELYWMSLSGLLRGLVASAATRGSVDEVGDSHGRRHQP